MAILTGSEIRKQIGLGRIVIEPYDDSLVNPNSVDVRLGPNILIKSIETEELSFRNGRRVDWQEWDLLERPFVLDRDWVVLGATIERTHTPFHVPMFEGKSSLGRQFVSPHFCAGFGDVGFEGNWTLEIHSLLPFTLRTGIKIGQIAFHTIEGDTDISYADTGRYQGQSGPTPARADKK